MHFDVLVEDASGKKALDILIPKIIGNQHTFSVTGYKGIGRIPSRLTSGTAANKHLLLDQLPRLLRAYGRTYAGYPSNCPTAVIVVCDLDNKCLKAFRQQLLAVLNACNPKPVTRFCIAIEEGEAWFLGDIPAIRAAYSKRNDRVLSGYKNDSICGTWELLADAIYTGGSGALRNQGWQSVGREKSAWSQRIAPMMDADNNASPSFCYFRDKLRELTGLSSPRTHCGH